MTEFIFWVGVGYVAYVYAGYPALLILARQLRGRRAVYCADVQERVTIVVSAFNEEDCIEGKLRNFQTLDYSKDSLRLVVVSDASSDGTDNIVSAFDDLRITLLRMPDRGGKTLGLNAALLQIPDGIVVFTDANAMFEPGAIRHLASNFADPSVGGVVGESGYQPSNAAADVEESRYWSYESFIKATETDLGSVVGGDGAIYAIRRALYEPMPADGLSDFLNPLQIVRRGYRFVYDRRAKCFEDGAETFEGEYRRKVRIVNRAWRTAMRMKGLLDFRRFGIFSAQFLSHKLLRWLVPFVLAALLVVSAMLAATAPIYAVALAGQLGVYLLAFAGMLLRSRSRLPAVLSLPYYFTLVNVASARGVIEAYLGKTYTTWNTVRETKST